MYIFGYGSLINAESIGKTLKRKVSYSEMTPAVIYGYSRSWTAAVDIELIREGGTQKARATFLDITESDRHCNGVILKVNEEELEFLAKREFGYELISLTAKTKDQEIEVFTFKVPNRNKTFDGYILTKYINIINEGLANFDKSFREDFWNQVIEHNYKEISCDYKFTF